MSNVSSSFNISPIGKPNLFQITDDETVPLSEDRELEGFLPLAQSFKLLNFKYESSQTESPSEEKQIRAQRLVNFGTWLTSYKVNGSNLIIR